MATATSRRRAAGLAAAAVAVAVAVVTVAVLAVTSAGHPATGGFPRLFPAAAPAGWHQVMLLNRTAVLSYPPSLRPVGGDTGTVSAARFGPGGTIQLYLNATPRQGAENLRSWASFRLRFLRADSAVSAHQMAAAHGIRFRGGTGSCVIDTYTTRIGHHHYQEIACLVAGHTSASVIVAAAQAAQWAQARPLLLRAVAAYQVR